MNMDKNDLVSFFQELRVLYSTTSLKTKNKNTSTEWMLKVEDYLTKDNVDLLDIKRMYRFLDKNVKKEDDIDEDEMGEVEEDDGGDSDFFEE